jgi:3-hydroxy-D-aspartate aldolase
MPGSLPAVSRGSRGPNEHLIGVPGSRNLLGTPALVLDLDRLDANIASMAAHARANGYALRPPAKIHKSVEIARRQVAAGALGQCCATLAEAEVMVAAGIPGVMLFSTVVTEPKLERLAALNARTDDLIVATDGFDNVDQLGAAARRSGRRLQVLADFEVGSHRTGLADESQVVALARRIQETKGLEYLGLHAYCGNHQAVVDYDERRTAAWAFLAPLVRLVERLTAEGLKPRVVSGGGTGTHDIDPDIGVLTEMQTGTYVFMDVYYKDVVLRRDEPHPFQHSLYVRSTVISAAQRGYVITDAGGKELGGVHPPEIQDGAPPGATYTLCGDDMGRIVFANPDEHLAVGDVVNVLPPYCFQTVVLNPAYHCIRGDDLVDIWPIDAFQNW